MTIFKGPYKVFTHGNIKETYFNAENLGFINFGTLEYYNIKIADHIIMSPYAYKNSDISSMATVKFHSGETIKNVNVYVTINISDKISITVVPNVISLWNELRKSNHKTLINKLEYDASINRSMYSRVTSDKLFCHLLSSVGVEKTLSFNQLFNDPIAKSFYLWKFNIGFSHNDLGAKFDVAGRKAEEELIKEYIESEKVYRTDPLRDKIDDSIHLMNVNGDKLKRQLWYFNNRY